LTNTTKITVTLVVPILKLSFFYKFLETHLKTNKNHGEGMNEATLNKQVRISTYDRKLLQSKIVHIGFGAFHRAHQALYTDETLEKKPSNWGICEVNLFGGEALIQQLREQNHRYLVAEKGSDETVIKMVNSITESLHPALDGQESILEKMAESQVAIVSMTITEKGYCIDPASGHLDKNNPLIQHDLQSPHKPNSAIGYIVEALARRKQRGLKAFTVMSCDNVQENGHIAQAAILDFSALINPELAVWIKENATFPCTMVDRIVPAATEETLNEIALLAGKKDLCAIACEPFRQWVIEDNFVAGRPDWNIAGAEFVKDVIPYEEMKLRMLNGSHSFLAYLGYLGNYQHISDTMINDDYRHAALELMIAEQSTTLNMPKGTDLEAYAQHLIDRFSNPSLKHQTYQIATDGSQKLPPRFCESLRHHRKLNNMPQGLTLGIAAWMVYVGGKDESGQPIVVNDPLQTTFADISKQFNTPQATVQALLSIDSIFTRDLAEDKLLVETLTQYYELIIENGARKTLSILKKH